MIVIQILASYDFEIIHIYLHISEKGFLRLKDIKFLFQLLNS